MRDPTWSRRDLYRGVLAVLILLYLILWPPLSRDWLPRLDGWALPVVGPFTPVDITTADGETTFYGTTEKFRDCTIVRVKWYFGKIGSDELRSSINIRTLNRPVGDIRGGPWRFPVDQDELRTSVYAVAWHRCHFLWDTATIFYLPTQPRPSP